MDRLPPKAVQQESRLGYTTAEIEEMGRAALEAAKSTTPPTTRKNIAPYVEELPGKRPESMPRAEDAPQELTPSS